MIDPKKTYKTRDGREVRILMTDGGVWNYPVIAAYKDKDGRWWPLHLTSDGRHSVGARESALDLIEVKLRIRREVWVNVYPDDSLIIFDDKQEADEYGPAYPNQSRIACVKLTIDVEEGRVCDDC